jgi:hypothetical protein
MVTLIFLIIGLFLITSSNSVINNEKNEEVVVIKHVAWTKDDSKLAKVNCVPSPACPNTSYYGYKVERTVMMLSDSKKKILMEIVPKADCSGATVMFLWNMGYRYNVEYSG